MTQIKPIDNLTQELRRGILVMAVLSQLQEERYGYEVIKLLADHGLEIDQGTLYPLLRRLENQGLLQSRWELKESRPRRYYSLSPDGKELLPQLWEEWSGIVATMESLKEI